MKKIMLILFSAFAACLFIVAKGNAIDAFADDDPTDVLSISARQLDASEVSEYDGESYVDENHLTAGDYIVTLSISNNTGFAGTGVKFYYDSSKFDPIINTSNGQPAAYMGEVAESILIPVFASNLPQSCVGMGTMGMNNATGDGCIFSIFFRKKPNVTATVAQILTDFEVKAWKTKNAVVIDVFDDLCNEGYTYITESSSVTCIIGDLDNDGYITSSDPQILYNIVSNCGDGNFELDYMYEFVGQTFYGVDGEYLLTVGDVNGDYVIDQNDVSALLSYYSTYIVAGASLSGYNGMIGDSVYLLVSQSTSF